MRILQIVRSLNPAWGGTVEAARTLCQSAKRRGFEVEIVAQDNADDAWVLSFSHKVHAIGTAPLTFGFSSALDQWLHANIAKYDAVIVNGIWMYLSYAVWKAAAKHNVRYYLFIHGFLDPWFKRQYPLKHIKKMLYWRAFEHKVVRDAAAVLFTTEEEEILARNAFMPYKANAVIAGFGIEAPKFANPNEDKAFFVKELNAAYPALKNRNYLLFLGRLHEKKGVDLLLTAFAAVKQKAHYTALVIAGPGDPKTSAALQALGTKLGLDQDVIWTGALYGDVKWNAIRGADAFVLPSHQENFGISVVESLASGTPVLISNKVNIWREVERDGAGLIENDTSEGTIKLLERWFALSGDERMAIAAQARKCFKQNFDEAHCSRRLLDMMEANYAASGAASGAALGAASDAFETTSSSL